MSHSLYDDSELRKCKSSPLWNNLMFLRNERDQLARTLRTMTWGGEKYVDGMVTGEMYGYHHLRKEFFEKHYHSMLSLLDIYRAVCLRVGRLEHEAAGQPIENYDMARA